MGFRRYNYVDFATNRDYTFASYYIDEDLMKYKRGCGERVVDVEVPIELKKEEKEKKLGVYLKSAVAITMLSFISSFIIDLVANSNRVALTLIFLTFVTILLIPINDLYKFICSKIYNLSIYEHLCDYIHTNKYCQYCDINSSFKQINQFIKEDVINGINLKHVEKHLEKNCYDSDCLKDLYFHSFKSLVPGSLTISLLSFIGSLVGSISTLTQLFNSISGNQASFIISIISYFIFIITISLAVSMHKYNKCINDLNSIYYITSFSSLETPYKLSNKEVNNRLIELNIDVNSIGESNSELSEKIYSLVKSAIPKSILSLRDIHINNKIYIFFENYYEIFNEKNFLKLKSIQDVNSFYCMFEYYCCK